MDQTIDEVGRRRPATVGGGGHGLLLGQGIGQLVDQVGEAVGAGARARWHPIGGAREEGEPVGGGAADDDAVDGVLELADKGIGRRVCEVGEFGQLVGLGGLVGLGSESEEARFGGAVAGEDGEGEGEGLGERPCHLVVSRIYTQIGDRQSGRCAIFVQTKGRRLPWGL